MPKLTDDIKNLIVTKLAQFGGYAEVARFVTEETGVVVERFQVRTYDPLNIAYAGGDKWRAIFEAVRHTYLTSVETVPIANQGYRLNQLQRNYDDARNRGNLVLANATLEQAAKEREASRQERKGFMQPYESPYAAMTPEERRQAVADLLNAALSAKKPPAHLPATISSE